MVIVSAQSLTGAVVGAATVGPDRVPVRGETPTAEAVCDAVVAQCRRGAPPSWAEWLVELDRRMPRGASRRPSSSRSATTYASAARARQTARRGSSRRA